MEKIGPSRKNNYSSDYSRGRLGPTKQLVATTEYTGRNLLIIPNDKPQDSKGKRLVRNDYSFC